jgi:uncharacterized membrane protein YadS
MSELTESTRTSIAAGALAARALTLTPGVVASFAVAVAASAAAGALHAPAMLSTLILGMALNPVFASQAVLAPGLAFSARTLVRLGIVLLGARVTVGDLAGLGLPTLLLVATIVPATIAGGWGIGRLLGLRSDQAALSAGAVAICGASAALAIAAVLPRREGSDRNTMLTIVGVRRGRAQHRRHGAVPGAGAGDRARSSHGRHFSGRQHP